MEFDFHLKNNFFHQKRFNIELSNSKSRGRFRFGLKQRQRSVLTIGMCTRNLEAAIAPLMTIQADSPLVVMVALGIPVTLIFAFLAAHWYARHSPQDKPAG